MEEIQYINMPGLFLKLMKIKPLLWKIEDVQTGRLFRDVTFIKECSSKTKNQTSKQKEFKVPITPKIFCGPNEWLCHAEQNFQKIFVFGQNWNFL